MTRPPLDEIVAAWRAIPALVVEMGGDPSRISAHQLSHMSSLQRSVYEQQESGPSVLLSWDGKLGREHQFSVYVQPHPERDLLDLLVLLESGTPTTGTAGQPIIRAQFHQKFDPMTQGISYSPRVVFTSENSPGFEYWVGNFSLGERGIYE